jgi:hypothetical protein
MDQTSELKSRNVLNIQIAASNERKQSCILLLATIPQNEAHGTENRASSSSKQLDSKVHGDPTPLSR